MRRSIPVLAVSAALAFATAACGQTPSRVGGNAAPVMSATPSGVAAGATSAPASPPGVIFPGDPAPALAMTAAGLGKLRLGMSLADAQATGLIGRYTPAPEGDCGSARLAIGGASVGFNKNYGLYTIGVTGKAGPSGTDFSGVLPLHTSDGIKLGSRLDTVKKTYPGYTAIDMSSFDANGVEDHTTGRAQAKLSGPVAYEFSFFKGTLYALDLTNTTYKCGD